MRYKLTDKFKPVERTSQVSQSICGFGLINQSEIEYEKEIRKIRDATIESVRSFPNQIQHFIRNFPLLFC